MIKLLVFFGIITCVSASAQTIPFSVSRDLWVDSLGDQRVVVFLNKNTDAAEVKVEWRRRDRDADKKTLIITDEKGKAVKNILIKNVNRETGNFIFEPNSGAGTYFVYYLSWSGHKNEGGFSGDYLRGQPKPDKNWIDRNRIFSGANLVEARSLEIQARTAFDNFYPMEVVAKSAEVKRLIAQHIKDDYLVFPEDREHPIKMFDDLPLRWIKSGPSDIFSGKALRNEYYVFQLGVFASRDDLTDLEAFYINAPFAITCFNLEGVNSKGNHFVKTVNVPKDKVQPLWFGVDIPPDTKPGNYSFAIRIKAANTKEKIIHVRLSVENKILKDHGDDDLWRLSRLRWLNSRMGIDDKNANGYLPLQVSGNEIKAKTADVLLNKYGLPEIITVNGDKQILAHPVSFLIENKDAETVFSGRLRFDKRTSGIVEWTSSAENNLYKIACKGSMEADGYLHYTIHLTPKKDFTADNIALLLSLKKRYGAYFMGMGSGKPDGRNGGYTPESYRWKWHGPQDAYWIGNYDAGIYCKLLGATYTGPLLNLYHPAPPPAWYNSNNGGFDIDTKDSAVNTATFTGQKFLRKDSSIDFEFALLITPVKQPDAWAQFADRYYQNNGNPYPPQADVKAGIKIINVHHATSVNPYINYPFVRADSIKSFVDRYHKAGIKVKIYYTVRELSDQCAEIWALRSLGNEIFSDGNGGGYPWLREHLTDHYDVQWFTPIEGYEACDAAIRTSGDSRWYNYYIAGLYWLVRHTGIDGLYLDDVAYDRPMLKRMRKVMERVKPGCMIDLHSNTGFSKGPATHYTTYFPYIDKLWFGESFDYEKMQPDNWLVETSGIPFGLMGDMLFHGGNPWRGLVYGMTNRDGWVTEGIICNPKPIWKALDQFGIRNAKMIGYWEKDNSVVGTNNPDVMATAYIRNDKILIAIASWAKDTVDVMLNIDWDKIGWISRDRSIKAPAIQDFQPEQKFDSNQRIQVAPYKGWLFIIDK